MTQHNNTMPGTILPIKHPVMLLAGGLLALGLNGCVTTAAKEATVADKPATTEASSLAPAPTAENAATAEPTATSDPAAANTAEAAAVPAETTPAPSQNELNKQLWDAAHIGDAATVSSLLQQGADANTATASGETALHAAVAAGSLPTVVQLVNQGANVNAVTSTGWTPLHHAARFGRADAANFLIQKGADPKATTNGSPPKTPVQMALDQGDLRTARILGY
jgi:hypothetical protein